MNVPDAVHPLPVELDTDGGTRRFWPCAVETDRGLVLVDAGFAHTTDQLEAGLAEAGFDLSDVRLVFLTHQDGDHVGGLARVVSETDAVVVASEHAARVVDGSEPPRGSDPDDDRYEPVAVDVALAGEATLDTRAGPARVVPTPGHTPGHVSLYFPEESFLLAGDAVTAADGELNGPDPTFTEEMDEALASVRTLSQLDISRTLCYHGGFAAAAGSDRMAAIAVDADGGR
ncbi:MBL fold metallo-hydrolase [Halogeometricum sp. S1BR25-6]|uniref:MBL fold metallo-hydrolase n=1 Tax=Halogeometricum salsisoli TaxID=2950536 RepID=A0ABU2GI65_9EURY|nr:MBL fold metallo-hydrolase [Halogeometricum sp. S1BR25-6]MDS0300505.1 MBL fold metallo-hydrolase [Halogeometricum sp. S1BR25-6]